MTNDQVEDFRKVEMSAEREPDCQRGGGAEDGSKPSGEDRQHLGGDQCRNAIWQLNEKSERARFFFAAQGSNGDEGKQQRRGEVKRTKGRHQHAVERGEAAGKHRRIPRGSARFAIERDRLEKAVTHERAQDQQHDPERARSLSPTARWQATDGSARAERRPSQVSARKTSSKAAAGFPVCVRSSARLPMPRMRPSASKTNRSQTRAASL